jgi:hypothetical protein
MYLNNGYIIMELAIHKQLVYFGRNILILNGFIGGSHHGTEIKNTIEWNGDYSLYMKII